MMAKRMPLSDTVVPVGRSVTAIIDLLESAGFKEIMQHTKDGKMQIYAKHEQATISVSPDVDSVYTVMTGGRKPYNPDKVRAQAERTAWRVQFEYVKATVDAIKWNAQTIAEGFGGRMMLEDDAGRKVYMADFLTEGFHSGKLEGSKVLALEHKK